VNLSDKIHWTSEITLEGSTYLTEEGNGSKGPNLAATAAADDDDEETQNTIDC
jgi:hypothetical protein